MTAQVCCVDHERPGTQSLGGRWFCDEHYAKATYKRNGATRSDIATVLGLLVFVVIVVGLDTALKPELSGAGLLLGGTVLAVVPAALWLMFFYRQDRLEPEPVGQVARMFVIGLALAGAIGIPLTDQLFRVQDWIYRDTPTTVLGSIFVIGGVQAFMVYATVRFFVFDSPEFDERTDGVIYATAAGLGVATALNLQFILSNGGAALGRGEIYVAEVAMAQAAFAGLLGYFMGRSKLEQEPNWWLAGGFLLTAILNGVFNLLRGQLDAGTISVGGQGGLPSFTGLLLAGGLALAVTILVSALISRDIARSLSGRQPAPTGDPAVGDRQANFVVIGTFAALLLVGAFAWNNAVNRTRAFDAAGVKGAYPAYFSDSTGDGDVLRVTDTLGTRATFVIASRAGEGQGPEDVVTQLTGERSTDYAVYKVTSRDTVTLNGRQAVMQRFSYVDPGLLGGAPEVREGIDYIFVADGQAVVVTLLTTPDDLPAIEPLFARFLNGLSF